MSSTGARETLQRYADECTLCGNCLNTCDLLPDLGILPAEIAQAVAADQVSHELLAAIQRGDMCGACDRDCTEGLSPAELFRVVLRETIGQHRAGC